MLTVQADVAGLKGDLAASRREVCAGQKRHTVVREQLQAVQQELEGLRRERPALTPRPARDITALKDLINNKKACAPSFVFVFCYCRKVFPITASQMQLS